MAINKLDDAQISRFAHILAESVGVSAKEAAEGFATLQQRELEKRLSKRRINGRIDD